MNGNEQNNHSIRDALFGIGAILLAHILVYRDFLTLHAVFTGVDHITLEVPVYNFQADCFKQGCWPLWNPFVNFGVPWVSNYLNYAFHPTHLLLGLLTDYGFRIAQFEILFWQLLCGAAMFLCAGSFGVSTIASSLAGIAYMFCGPVLALPTWSNQLCNAACFPLMIYGYRRAAASGAQAGFICALAMACSFLGGYVASALLGFYILAGYILADSWFSGRPRSGARFVFFTYLLSALIAAPKLLPMAADMALSARTAEGGLSSPLFGITGCYNMMSLFIPVKFFFSLYCGTLAALAALWALLRRDLGKGKAALLLCALSAWFLAVTADGGGSWPALILDIALPFLRLVRLHFLYWYYPAALFLIFSAQHIDGFLATARLRAAAAALFCGLAAVFFLSAYDIKSFYPVFAAQLAFALAWYALPYLRMKRQLFVPAVFLLSLADFYLAAERVLPKTGFTETNGNIRLTTIHQNRTDRSFRSRQLVAEKMEKEFPDDRRRPSFADAAKNPRLSPYESRAHGTIAAANEKRFAGIWYNVQETYKFAELKKSRHFDALDGKPLAELRTASGKTLPASLIGFSCGEFLLETDSSEPGTLILRQMFDKRWRASVNGKTAEVSTEDGFFMSLPLPAGRNRADFVFRDRLFSLSLFISAAALLAMLLHSFKLLRRLL